MRVIQWSESPIYLTRARNAFGCRSHVGNVSGNASQLHQSQLNPQGCVFQSLPSQKCTGSEAPGAHVKHSRPTSGCLNTLLRGQETAWETSLCSAGGSFLSPSFCSLDCLPDGISNSHLALEEVGTFQYKTQENSWIFRPRSISHLCLEIC